MLNKMNKKQEGIIAIEASVSLCLFMFLMFFLYSFFLIFESQYTIEHALLQAGKSMAIESYATDNIVKTNGSVGDFILHSGSIGTIVQQLFLSKTTQNAEYIAYSKWYEDENKTKEIAKQRFCAYMAGDEELTDELLKKMRVRNGLEGIDFSGTRVDGNDLYIEVKYTNNIIFDFPALGLGKIDMALSTKTALWK